MAVENIKTGKLIDFKLGLYYYKARMYSPTLGRFLQTDPIGTKDDLNLYAYVKNNPVNLTDPLGLAAQCSMSDTFGQGFGKSDAITPVYSEAALIPAARMAQTIYNVVSGVGASKADIRFGANQNQTTHTFRHVIDQGFDASAVQSAVSSSLGKVAECLP